MLQQATKEKYGIETLKERNVSYDHEHGLTQKDVDMANNHVQLIERSLRSDPGDEKAVQSGQHSFKSKRY